MFNKGPRFLYVGNNGRVKNDDTGIMVDTKTGVEYMCRFTTGVTVLVD